MVSVLSSPWACACGHSSKLKATTTPHAGPARRLNHSSLQCAHCASFLSPSQFSVDLAAARTAGIFPKTLRLAFRPRNGGIIACACRAHFSLGARVHAHKSNRWRGIFEYNIWMVPECTILDIVCRRRCRCRPVGQRQALRFAYIFNSI